MFSKLLRFAILPVESFYHRRTTNAENYISSLRIFPCSTMLHQRSVQGSNDSRENSRQKFPSIHPSIPFEFLVELVVSKEETPPSLSVPTPRFRWNEETAVRLIGNTVRDIISSGKLPSLVRTTGTIFRHGDVRNASYCCV